MKLQVTAEPAALTASPPARGRGLKLGALPLLAAPDVAPRAGAWIETRIFVVMPVLTRMSPPARGRGLKR